MRLKIQNINKVQEADIKLDGLTVIAGANSSGKSTVGKLLFSIIKAISNADELSHQGKENKLRKRVNQLYNRVNGCFSRYEDESINEMFPLPSNKMVECLLGLEDKESVEEYLSQILFWVDSKGVTPRLKSLFDEDIENIRIALGDSQAADLASEVRSFVESEFMGNICSYGTDASSAAFELNGENDSVEFLFKNNRVSKVSIKYEDHLADATYVESPLYLHILDTLLYAMTYREYQKKPRTLFRGMVPIHIKDLASKLYALQMASSDGEISQQLGLSEIMGGKFAFDNDSKTLKFAQDNIGVDFSPINIASGIKTFGLVQILLDTLVIGNNKILIWDEPENHLHPKWQIAFAEVLVRLAKRGIPVVISTHSPYFIQGVRYFSAKHEMESFTNYYLAEEQENHLSILKEVTRDLNLVFSKLAEPLKEIMNINSVNRERL